MPSSPSHPGLRASGGSLRPVWSVALEARPRGLALAREKDWLLAWDDAGWLYLLDRKGERQAQRHGEGPAAAACAAEDGSAYVAVGGRGDVCWLTPDLMPRWRRTLPFSPLAAAMDPFGRVLAVSDSRGNLYLLDHEGRSVGEAQTPRPLHHLAFVPEAPRLVGCADFGLVACFDMRGRCIWRDGLVAHVGSLTTSGDGSHIALACFSDGLRFYKLDGKKRPTLALGEPCRLAALSYAGDRALTAGLDRRLALLDPTGRTLSSATLDAAVTALAMAPLGGAAAVALADGQVARLSIQGTG